MLRRKLRWWDKNVTAWYRLDAINKHFELFGLIVDARLKQKEFRDKLNRFLKSEELKWLQRCKEKEIK